MYAYNTITVDVAKYRVGKVKFKQMLPANGRASSSAVCDL